MKFKKGSFYIQLIPNAKTQFVLANGWISDDGQFGFSKHKNFWIATDIASGMKIYECETRKECAEAIEQNIDLINIARTYKTTRDAVEAMRKFCEKELRESYANS